MNETIVRLIQAPSDVEYTCPWCRERIIQDFEDFLDDQGLSWSNFPDWQFENITCSSCGEEIDNIFYEFD